MTTTGNQTSGAVRRGSSPTAGLYGSRPGERLLRATVTEFLGTAVLVFVGTSAAVANAVAASCAGM